jgi:hypothetical protein
MRAASRPRHCEEEGKAGTEQKAQPRVAQAITQAITQATT